MIRIYLLMVFGGIACMQAAEAVQPKTASELHSHCENFAADKADSESLICANYIAGFVDGAISVDARVAENVAEDIERFGKIDERAVRAHVTRRIKDHGSSVYAAFCVARAVSIEEVVKHVMEELEGYELLEDVLAPSVVYASLRRNYPCAASTE